MILYALIFFVREVLLLYFLNGLHPKTLTFLLAFLLAHFGKSLNISLAKIFTFAVHP